MCATGHRGTCLKEHNHEGGVEVEGTKLWSLSVPAEPWRAGDGCQRPLVPRSRCQPRLTPSVRRPSTTWCQ